MKEINFQNFTNQKNLQIIQLMEIIKKIKLKEALKRHINIKKKKEDNTERYNVKNGENYIILQVAS
jgi:hypothetical protein